MVVWVCHCLILKKKIKHKNLMVIRHMGGGKQN